MEALRILCLVVGILVCGVARSNGESSGIEPLSKEWSPLAMVTGFHSLVHKESGLTLRVLEADGSSSVARDPVSIFVVATNQGTSDLQEHVWRLPRGVARVRKVTASKCGLDVAVDVDAIEDEQGIVGQKPNILRACFINAKGVLEPLLWLTEAGPSGGSAPSVRSPHQR